jgi:hypothetical protein
MDRRVPTCEALKGSIEMQVLAIACLSSVGENPNAIFQTKA